MPAIYKPAVWGHIPWMSRRPDPFIGMRIFGIGCAEWGTIIGLPNTNGCDPDEWPMQYDYEKKYEGGCYRLTVTGIGAWKLPGDDLCPSDPSLADKEWVSGDIIWSRIRARIYNGAWFKLQLTASVGIAIILEGPKHLAQIAMDKNIIRESVIYVPQTQVAQRNPAFCSCSKPNLITNTVMGSSFQYCRSCKKERK